MMVDALILAKNIASATAVATMVVSPGSVVAASSTAVMRALNLIVYGHYAVYATRLACKCVSTKVWNK